MTVLIASALVIWSVVGLTVWVWDITETRKNRAVLSRLLDLSKEHREVRLGDLNAPQLVTAGKDLA